MSRCAVAVTLCSIAALYICGIVDHDLWTPDEPRVAAVGKSVTQGHWVVPQLGDSIFLEQPPLHAWAVGAWYGVFPHADYRSARWLAALFGVGGLFLTAALARRLARKERRRDVGLTAALLLGVSLEYWTTSHRLVVDGLLTLCTTASVYAYWVGLDGVPARKTWGCAVLGGVFASLAFLTKGPIGVAIPGLFLVAWAIVHRAPRRLLPALIAGPLAFLLVAGPWLGLAYRERGAEILYLLFVDNLLGRVAADIGSRGHVRPFYYYALYFPVHLLPLTIPFAAAVLARLGARHRTPGERSDSRIDTLLIWIVLVFVMLSIASTKRALYTVPIFPAAAIVTALWLDGLLAETSTRLPRWLAAIAGILILGIAAAPLIIRLGFLPTVTLGAAFLTLSVGVVASLVCVALSRRHRHHAIPSWSAAFSTTLVAALFALLPPLDEIKSLGPVTKDIATLVPASETIYLLEPDEVTEGLFPLYADRAAQALRSADDLSEAVARHGQLYVVAVDKTYRKRHRRYEMLKTYQGVILLEDLRPRSRALRLLQVRTAD